MSSPLNSSQTSPQKSSQGSPPPQNSPTKKELIDKELIIDKEIILVDGQQEMDLGVLEVNETKELNFSITCRIPKIKVICEQETEPKVEVKPYSVTFKSVETKNLKIKFKVKQGTSPILVFKVEKLKNNKTISDEDLKRLEKRIKLKYNTKLSIINNILENEVVIEKEIGGGKEGTIYKAKYEGGVVAIKACNPQNGMNESKNMLYFRNKYIVEYKKNFYKVIKNKQCYCTMLEYAEHGSLESKKLIIEPHMLYKIMEDVCKALKYLHEEKNVIHRDIKPDNILIINFDKISEVNAKLTDFGTCDVVMNEGNTTKVGTEYFMAPEVVKGEKYSKKCDIYSFGITMLVSFLKIKLGEYKKYIVENEENKENGTYIKFNVDIIPCLRQFICDCCQIDPSKRPDIIECLKRIHEIGTKFGDKDIFKPLNPNHEEVQFSIPKFDLLKSVEIVVESIRKYEVTNNFIKGRIMMHLGGNEDDAKQPMDKNDDSFKNEGDGDFIKACKYLENENKDFESINKGYELMASAASKLQPDAIIRIIDVLIGIVDGKIKIFHNEEYQIKLCINDIYATLSEPNSSNTQLHCPTQPTKNSETITPKVVVNLLLALRQYIPICELQYGIALLHGVGTNISVSKAETSFNRLIGSKCYNDPQEVEFFQAYCKSIKQNTDNDDKEAYLFLKNCLANSEKQYYYYSDALNNEGVLLCKGLGCEKDIDEAFKCFEKSKNLKNDYGKFNYEQLHALRSTKCVDMKIIKKLADNGLDIAQKLYAIYKSEDYLDNPNSKLRKIIRLWAQSSLQLDCYSIYHLGFWLNKWNREDNNDNDKLKKITFNLYEIASNNGYLRAQIELINCYLSGNGTDKNLEKAKEWCVKTLENIKENEGDECFRNDEYSKEDIKISRITVECQYFKVLKQIYLKDKKEQKQDKELQQEVQKKAMKFFKTLESDSKTVFEIGLCYCKGIFVEQNINKAIECFEKTENRAGANYELGKIYLNENSGKKDIGKAIKYFEKARNKEHPRSSYRLGKIYSGKNVAKDIDKAIEYFKNLQDWNIHILLIN